MSACLLGPFAQNTFIHSFTLRGHMSLMVKCISWMYQKDGFCFLILSVSLCLFIEEMMPLILRIMSNQCLLFPDIYFVVAVCFFLLFWLNVLWLLIPYVLLSPDGCFPSSAFNRVRLIDRNSFSFFLMKCFLFWLVVIYSLIGYSSLAWHLWSLRVCRWFFQAFLSFRVSIEIRCYSNVSTLICGLVFSPCSI